MDLFVNHEKTLLTMHEVMFSTKGGQNFAKLQKLRNPSDQITLIDGNKKPLLTQEDLVEYKFNEFMNFSPHKQSSINSSTNASAVFFSDKKQQ